MRFEWRAGCCKQTIIWREGQAQIIRFKKVVIFREIYIFFFFNYVCSIYYVQNCTLFCFLLIRKEKKLTIKSNDLYILFAVTDLKFQKIGSFHKTLQNRAPPIFHYILNKNKNYECPFHLNNRRTITISNSKLLCAFQ